MRFMMMSVAAAGMLALGATAHAQTTNNMSNTGAPSAYGNGENHAPDLKEPPSQGAGSMDTGKGALNPNGAAADMANGVKRGSPEGSTAMPERSSGD